MRLVGFLLEHPAAARPETYALAALFSLHAARLPARVDLEGDLNPLVSQDRSRWDAQLVEDSPCWNGPPKGGRYGLPPGSGDRRRPCQCAQRRGDGLGGGRVPLRPPDGRGAVACRRPEPRDRGRLERYPFLPAAIGELELRRGDREAARKHFAAALRLARNPTERRFLEKCVRACQLGSDLEDWREIPPAHPEELCRRVPVLEATGNHHRFISIDPSGSEGSDDAARLAQPDARRNVCLMRVLVTGSAGHLGAGRLESHSAAGGRSCRQGSGSA